MSDLELNVKLNSQLRCSASSPLASWRAGRFRNQVVNSNVSLYEVLGFYINRLVLTVFNDPSCRIVSVQVKAFQDSLLPVNDGAHSAGGQCKVV